MRKITLSIALFSMFTGALTMVSASGKTTIVNTQEKVNINMATKAALEKVGFGPKLADEIIKARPFKDEKDLLKRVKISSSIWMKVMNYITFK